MSPNKIKFYFYSNVYYQISSRSVLFTGKEVSAAVKTVTSIFNRPSSPIVTKTGTRWFRLIFWSPTKRKGKTGSANPKHANRDIRQPDFYWNRPDSTMLSHSTQKKQRKVEGTGRCRWSREWHFYNAIVALFCNRRGEKKW